MQYKLLNNNKGILLTREPEVIADKLSLAFLGAPENATAIFEKENGGSMYKPLENGSCALPADFLSGKIAVTVVVLNGELNPPKWSCEGIKAVKEDDVLIVYPNDLDAQHRIVGLELAQNDLREEIKTLKEKFTELNDKFNKLVEGYDFI